MKVKLMGAARTVTGSCYIVEAAGRRFAIDCGMHQGNEEIEKRNWDVDLYKPQEIEFILMTHAHMDHSGLIPRLVQKGFKGKIYMTPPTWELLHIMLLDSAHIQEMEAQWKSVKQRRHGESTIAPLYVQKDAMDSFPLFSAITYDEPFSPFPGLTVTFRDAGHILGAAMIELSLTEDGKQSKIVFSGDIGRPSQLIVRDPAVIKEADFLFMESTYGNRNHKDEKDSLDELAEAIAYSYKRHEKVIIPAFAVERTQEMIYSLHLLAKDGRLPDIPVYVDSPLAIQATEIFKKCKKYMDEEARLILENGDDPLQLPRLQYTQSTAESIEINNKKGPAIVISASGMANAGRIKHHLRHNLWREGASVVFVGFQAQGTPGRKIIDGAEKIHILNEDVAVRAKIFTINGFSAHAGQTQLLEWFGHFKNRDIKLFLTHGEYTAQQELARLIKERFDVVAAIPDYLEEITLTPGMQPKVVAYPEKAEPRIDWGYLIADLEGRLAQIQNRREAMEKKSWVEQVDLRDRLLETSRDLAGIIAEI
ncbi:MAG: MBL fold metallo-hydrolase [Syntrophales bacterium]|jgi:metallo-beta-lactamase family protein|nr:MBL fold metallo-hydrolase [Syntrophales bacterium]